jgi:hypothetical protein
MGRSNKDEKLTHSEYTIEGGHGGMKRNRVTPRRYPKKMDPFTRASQELMGDRPRSWADSQGRWHRTSDLSNPPNPQTEVQSDAQEQIDQSVRSGGGGGGGGIRSSAPSNISFSNPFGGMSSWSRPKRGVVTIEDLPE